MVDSNVFCVWFFVLWEKHEESRMGRNVPGRCRNAWNVECRVLPAGLGLACCLACCLLCWEKAPCLPAGWLACFCRERAVQESSHVFCFLGLFAGTDRVPIKKAGNFFLSIKKSDFSLISGFCLNFVLI